MALLASDERIRKWYRRDSWVYKNFTYFYQNKLWSTSIPLSRSVCPYFWSALVALFVLRPILSLLTRIVIPLGKLLGLGIAPFDRWVIRTLYRIFDGKQMDPNRAIQTPVGVGSVLVILIGGATALMVWAGYRFNKAYGSTLTSEPVLNWFFWVAISGIGLLVVNSIYHIKFKRDDSRCNVWAYWYVWLAGVLVSTMFIREQTFWLLGQVGSGIANIASTIGHRLWFGVHWLFCTGAPACGEWLLWIAKQICHGIYIAISYSPFFGVPLASMIAVFMLAGFIFDRFMVWYDSRSRKYYDAQLTPAQKKANNRRKWVASIVRCLTTGNHAIRMQDMAGLTLSRNQLTAIRSSIGTEMMMDAVEEYFKGVLDKIEENPPEIAPTFWTTDGANTHCTIYGKLTSFIPNTAFDGFELELGALKNKIVEVYPRYSVRIDEIAKRYDQQDAEDSRAMIARKNSWSRKTCKQVTRSITETASRLKDVIATIFDAFIGIIVWLFRDILWRGIVGNTWTFLCYMWVLVKAKKQKACPHLAFEDPPGPEPTVSSKPAT